MVATVGPALVHITAWLASLRSVQELTALFDEPWAGPQSLQEHGRGVRPGLGVQRGSPFVRVLKWGVPGEDEHPAKRTTSVKTWPMGDSGSQGKL